MNSENVCPTVPPLYTWDSGTRDDSGTDLGTRAGQTSLKALAQAVLSVPSERDKVGQGKNLVPRAAGVLGQKTAHTFPLGEEKSYPLGYPALSELKQNGLISACVETVVDDMMREWIEIEYEEAE